MYKILIFLVACTAVVILLAGHNESSGVFPQRQVTTDADYEYDLTERCKDWIYFRNKIIKLSNVGDKEGAEDARKLMQSYMEGLEARFSSEEISAEISRLENLKK